MSDNMQTVLEKEMTWLSLSVDKVFESKKKDTYKAIIRLHDGKLVESVIMLNGKKCWTLCVSSQVGCAMKCTFCSTGKMGFTRNMDCDEIVDQYRFWDRYLEEHPEMHQEISNIVFMGMGEPLGNYNNVKKATPAFL